MILCLIFATSSNVSLIRNLLKFLKEEESNFEKKSDKPRVGELIQEIIGRNGMFSL